MSLHRLTKQINYAGGCLTVVIAIIAGITWLSSRPAPPPPVPSPTPSYAPIQVEQVSGISHEPTDPLSSRTVDIVAQLRNPNPHAGIAEYPLTFILFDSQGGKIAEQPVTTFLLPGALQYAVALNIALPTKLGRIEVKTPETPSFTELTAAVSLPSFSSFARERTTRTVGSTILEEQKGIVRSTSTFDWQRVEVVGVALNAQGKIIGVGKTFVGALTIGEEREFTLQWPLPSEPTKQVIIIPATNVYLEENVIKIIGNPNLLR